jgi:hypothetical protein
MLTDLWLIAQLLLQTCSIFLLGYSTFYALKIVRKWQVNTINETQLLLEKQNYLVGTLAQIVLFFQLLGLVFFIFTANIHLPSLIKGAMCASGVLASNEFGKPLLYIKLFSIIIYLVFMIYEQLDNAEPAYPLTPKKYYWLFPSFLLLLADFVLQINFYININPDRIVTCCSLNFIASNNTNTLLFFGNQVFTKISLVIFVILFVILNLLLFVLKQKNKKINYIQFLIGALYIGFAIATLQEFFVKYIYGIPTHNCLYDLFLPHYYSIGFLLFGLYYLIFVGLLFKIILVSQQNLLITNYQIKLKSINLLIFVALLLSFIIPVCFWLLWEGNL